jgi:arylsulfatase A-like enzyme
MIKQYLILFSLFILLFFPSCSKEAAQPNILLIMVDDMGYSDIGCYGSEISTPNLDQLANEGLRFTQFYNASRCCPTRASLLTGLYPHQAGMGSMVSTRNDPGPYQGYLNDQSATIAEVLKGAGYTTLMSGKWHVGEQKPNWPTDRGFDHYFGLISGGANYYDITKGKNETVKRKMALDGEPWTPPAEGFYMTDAITEHAVQFMQEYTDKNNPFFMYVAYTAPHWPLHAPKEDIQKYLGTYASGWDKLRTQRYQRMIDLGLVDQKWPLSPRDPETLPWNDVKDKQLMDRKMAVYAAQIDHMDRGVGQILETLKKQGMAENTLVMFLSDNGACHEGGALGFDRRNNGVPIGGVDSYASYGRSWSNAGNTPFRMHKHWVHEGGIATPLIVRWPETVKEGGGLTNQVGHIVDVMATCCDVAGIKYPSEIAGRSVTPVQGKSLLPVLNSQIRDGHEYLFWEHQGNKAVRWGEWKLVSKDRGVWELYNLEEDRTELNDVSKENVDIANELKTAWEDWAVKVGVRK